VSGKALCVAMSASDSRLYLGGHSGVWRSDDGGQRWVHLEQRQPPSVTLVAGALLPPSVYDFHIMPDPDVAFAATGNDTRMPPTNGIYRSGAVTYARQFIALTATAADHAGYLGNWVLAAGATGIQGLPVHEYLLRGLSGPRPDSPTYLRATTLHTQSSSGSPGP
jgi:hypothetical protein